MGVIYSKIVGKWGTRLVQKSRTLIEDGRHPTVLSNSRTKNYARRVRNVMEPVLGSEKIKIKPKTSEIRIFRLVRISVRNFLY